MKVLVVDDQPQALHAFRRVLVRAGYAVTTEVDAPAAMDALGDGDFDVVLTDLGLPSGSGMDVLAAARRFDPGLPVVIVTGACDVATAREAVERGALRFLTKPVTSDQLLAAVGEALRARTVTAVSLGRGSARMRALETDLSRVAKATELDAALERLWMALQPVTSLQRRRVVGYEALVRSDHATLGRPDLLIAAAEELGRLHDLGRRVREIVARRFDEVPGDIEILVNLHPSDLADPDLFDVAAPLSRWAPRVILEITERASLAEIDDVQDRVAQLRGLGYRIAIDDLGAGYGSLSAMALIRPDLVKIDMSLVRNVDVDPVRLRMIRSIGTMCEQLGTPWLCEGVETRAELEALVASGVDLVQGYLLGRPERAPKTPPTEVLAAIPRGAPPRRPSQRMALGATAHLLCKQALVAAATPTVPVELRSLLTVLHDLLAQMTE